MQHTQLRTIPLHPDPLPCPDRRHTPREDREPLPPSSSRRRHRPGPHGDPPPPHPMGASVLSTRHTCIPITFMPYCPASCRSACNRDQQRRPHGSPMPARRQGGPAPPWPLRPYNDRGLRPVMDWRGPGGDPCPASALRDGSSVRGSRCRGVMIGGRWRVAMAVGSPPGRRPLLSRRGVVRSAGASGRAPRAVLRGRGVVLGRSTLFPVTGPGSSPCPMT